MQMTTFIRSCTVLWGVCVSALMVVSLVVASELPRRPQAEVLFPTHRDVVAVVARWTPGVISVLSGI